MNSGLRFFKQAVRMGLIDGSQARNAYRQSREAGQSAQEYAIDEGLVTPADADRVLQAMEGKPKPPASVPLMPGGIEGYQIVKRLGAGGMGSVYQAEQLAMAREVALKVLASQYARDENFVQRFMREARAAGRVNDPYVVTCFDAGRDGETLYMALELVEGGDTHQLMLRSGGFLPEERVLQIAADCCKGLAAIDRAGLVHRDIKPSNILLDGEGRAKLGDLGLARNMGEDDNLSVSGEIFGTPAYMSPEHARGDTDLDIRTDIYSLGASLFTLLTGRQPFNGKSSLDIASKVLSAPVPDPREHRAEISRATAAMVLKAMGKDRTLRYQKPDDMLADIESIRTTGRLSEVSSESGRSGDLSIHWHEELAVVQPNGALGQDDNGQWHEAVHSVSERGSKGMIIDCTSVEWISSEGLAFLVSLVKDCQDLGLHFGICNLNESTEKAIRVVQLHRLLPLYETLDQAVDSLIAA